MTNKTREQLAHEALQPYATSKDWHVSIYVRDNRPCVTLFNEKTNQEVTEYGADHAEASFAVVAKLTKK